MKLKIKQRKGREIRCGMDDVAKKQQNEFGERKRKTKRNVDDYWVRRVGSEREEKGEMWEMVKNEIRECWSAQNGKREEKEFKKGRKGRERKQ